ncbi:dihydrofolate reductase [Acipenser oxyrinchus oxyrinchus]|uniref:dihydrofolate reductase n=1 Tax=Acipenser oxyrinchus oxyrinchus TaxID=40147 RepID=A0AAD8DHW4_ACIOX|nr:dihydrofolate reductase [Acipenser oxyrinchus oxyrinchus]
MCDCGEKAHAKPIRLIAAACNNMGIGKNGYLPWNLPSEFTFFLDTISSVSTPGMKNLLVWGRKCWEAFPESLRPLPNTMHVVLSRTLRQVISVPKHAQYLCSDLQGSVKLGSTHPLSEVIETIWIIGGVEPYIEALQHPWCDLVYLTDVQADFECDTYFPEFNNNVYKLVDEFPGVPSGIQEENGIKFKYQVFKKVAQ